MLKLPGQPIDAGELTEKEIIRAERNSGVISNRVREIQVYITWPIFCNCLECVEFLSELAVSEL